MPSEETHEGLVLRSVDFKDRQKIITLYTPLRGLISLIVKGVNRKKTHLLTLTSPFTIAEYHLSVRRSALYTFLDGTPLFTNHFLRANLSHLQGATAIVKALLASQLPDKPAPQLYQLTRIYLQSLPAFEDPLPLIASYYLKLLKHEGLLNPTHREPIFTPSEWETLLLLAGVRNIATLQTSAPLSLELHRKIETTFHRKIDK